MKIFIIQDLDKLHIFYSSMIHPDIPNEKIQSIDSPTDVLRDNGYERSMNFLIVWLSLAVKICNQAMKQKLTFIRKVFLFQF